MFCYCYSKIKAKVKAGFFFQLWKLKSHFPCRFEAVSQHNQESTESCASQQGVPSVHIGEASLSAARAPWDPRLTEEEPGALPYLLSWLSELSKWGKGWAQVATESNVCGVLLRPRMRENRERKVSDQEAVGEGLCPTEMRNRFWTFEI